MGGCLFLVALLVAVRWMANAGWSPGPAGERVLRELMIAEQQLFLWPWAYGTTHGELLLLAAGVLVVALHRRLPPLVVVRAQDVWRLTPGATAILATVLLWAQFLFDANPTVGVVGGAWLLLLWCARRLGLARRVPFAAAVAFWLAFFAACLVAAPDAADRITIGLWAVLVLGARRWLVPRVAGSTLLLLGAFAVGALNGVASVLPLFVPLHRGTLLAPGVAYSFCEVPGRNVVYATLPVCDSVRISYDECKDGRIVEYDLATRAQVAEHRFFSPDFYGRLELLDCLPDEVDVAVQGTVLQGRRIVQSALAFPVADPAVFNPIMAGRGVGITIAYDARHEAVFYTAEFSEQFVRYDRRTNQRVDVAGPALLRDWIEPVSLEAYTGSAFAYTRSIHPARNRIYLVEWMQGRYAYAIDLSTLQVVERYDISGGGGVGIAVDVERDRLLVSSLWGLEVFDLATGARIARRRLGLGVRPMLVDAARNRIYATSTMEGKIRILDRDTYAVIAQLPIGIGSRYPYVTRDRRTFLASSSAAHYYWDADELLPDP